MIARPSYRNTWQELSAEKAMVFMAGPRQSGKTTLAQMIADEHANRLYFNWDIPTDRIRLIEQPFFFRDALLHAALQSRQSIVHTVALKRSQNRLQHHRWLAGDLRTLFSHLQPDPLDPQHCEGNSEGA
jgi:hypothetical protein